MKQKKVNLVGADVIWHQLMLRNSKSSKRFKSSKVAKVALFAEGSPGYSLIQYSNSCCFRFTSLVVSPPELRWPSVQCGHVWPHHLVQVWKSWEALEATDIQKFAAAVACIFQGGRSAM